MEFTVDRIENDKIVLCTKDGKTMDMDIMLCPLAKEGDVVEIRINEEKTDGRKKKMEERWNRLKKGGI